MRRLLHEAVTLARRDRALARAAAWLRGAEALEIGGPSEVFRRRGPLPLYPQLQQLDVIDYAANTLWSEQQTAWAAPIARRFVAEAAELTDIPDSAYDALLASHVIEHLANPLRALAEWRRVIRPSGWIVLVVPHGEGTFDHRRPVTSLAHLREDQARSTREDDLTHLNEVLALHDLSRDPGAGTAAAFAERCSRNAEVRGMHHHVFDTAAVAELCAAGGLRLELLTAALPFHVFAICRLAEEPGGETPHLRRALEASPFASDRERARVSY